MIPEPPHVLTLKEAAALLRLHKSTLANLALAGIAKGTKVGRHGLRHTWATWHIQNGTPLEVLQKLGGWSDLRMVMNYSHHSPGHLASFADNTRKKT